MSHFIDEIPIEFQPDLKEHQDFPIAFRATRSTDSLKKEDFLPSFIENPNKTKIWKDLYSMSLFKEEKELNEKLLSVPTLSKKTKSISIGFTCANRGVSILTRKSTGHISYFLFDSYNNNPYPDFKIHKVIENEN